MFGTVLALILAFYVVNFGLHKTRMSQTMQAALDVPWGEYKSMSINKEKDGYSLRMNGMSLYSTKKQKAVVCTSDIRLMFAKESEAKLVMKFRYNVGPFMAKALRKMTPEQAQTDKGKAMMVKTLKDGYAAQYGIKSIRTVEFSGLSCGVGE